MNSKYWVFLLVGFLVFSFIPLQPPVFAQSAPGIGASRVGASDVTPDTSPPGLVLWNKLGSQYAIEHSEVGPNGTFGGGAFIPGKFEYAYLARYDQPGLVTFPKAAVPIERGTSAVWVNLFDTPETIPGSPNPILCEVKDSRSLFQLGYNGNNGPGLGGLCGFAGAVFSTATGRAGDWTYEAASGNKGIAEWHHYALIWDRDGIAGVDTGQRKVAVFVDGELNSNYWDDLGLQTFLPLTGGDLSLMTEMRDLSQGSVAFENLKIWDYARTEFDEPNPPKPRITVGLNVQPDSSRNFQFYGPVSNFKLDDPGFDDGDPYASSITFDQIPSGKHCFSDALPFRWSLNAITCSQPAKCAVDLAQHSVCITVNNGDDLTIAFRINRREHSTYAATGTRMPTGSATGANRC
ncbi:MAG: hypothetical protein IPK16_20530 [Anaerolineales bacterium]|nr:hypothetical protein [Anaerolineales bacterium]